MIDEKNLTLIYEPYFLREMQKMGWLNNRRRFLFWESKKYLGLDFLKSKFSEITTAHFHDLDEKRHPMMIRKFLEGMPNLRKLIIRHCSLDKIPEPIFKINRKLEEITFENCFLTYIPATIADLKNLTYLSFDYNRIMMVPIRLYDLKRLKYISLRHNQMKVFPKGLLKMKGVERIDLRSNKISIDYDEIERGKNEYYGKVEFFVNGRADFRIEGGRKRKQFKPTIVMI